jgi:hypothetical protein
MCQSVRPEMCILYGNIIGYSLDIECDNITFDGAEFTLQGGTLNSNTGIVLQANNVTIKNINIHQYFSGMKVTGSSNIITGICLDDMQVTGSRNTISENNMSLPYLLGNYNTIAKNKISYVHIWGGDYNNVTQNTVGSFDVDVRYSNITGNFVSGCFYFLEQSRFNTIVGNTIKDAVIALNTEPNVFYLNSFMNNTFKVDFSPVRIGSPSAYSVNIFGNGSLGNYWSNYNGTDANHDGIGDTPYAVTIIDYKSQVLDANVTDPYPLMLPYDIENNTIIVPPASEPFPTALAVASGVTVTVVVAASLLAYFKKRKR